MPHHPTLNEARAHRLLLERLVGSLNLPDEEEDVGLRPGQRQAQKAARARWQPQTSGKLAELRGETA